MEVVNKGTFYHCTFSRMHIFDLWCTTEGSYIDKARNILQILMQQLPEEAENVNVGSLHNRLNSLSRSLSTFWKNTSRTRAAVNAKYNEWLNSVEAVDLHIGMTSSPASVLVLDNECDKNLKLGRPKKDFGSCSKRTKRRRLAELSQVDKSAVNVLADISTDSIRSEVNEDECLSLLIEAKLTKHQYQLIQKFINSKKNPVLPSYVKILRAKKRCYPEEEKISVNEKSAEVELQNLLDHTASRILDSQKDVLNSIDYETLGEVTLIGKWGFDGSTGHSEYKQRFSEDGDLQDGSLFVTSYVPLRLVSVVATTDEEKILWKNPRPSSTKYCRPIRFQFTKETKEQTIHEESYFKEKIKNLTPTVYKTQNVEINVYHELQLTMVDGKVCVALTDNTSTNTCLICKAFPTEMNSINNCLCKEIDVDALRFGLSPLHAWIRFFEYLVHVSYRRNIKKWRVQTGEEKDIMSKDKKEIQNEFKEKLGLIVDKPRSGGSGTSNDGNTARRFFENSAISAEITGIKKELIDRCGTILKCINSGYKINSERYNDYALETARQLIKEYEWYYMPASVHKVLIHGAQVIEYVMLPIGELSEEAAESTNKNIKQFRLNNTRKMSRTKTNTDLLNRLLVNSDPMITGLRKLPKKKTQSMSQSVLSLLDV